MNLPEADQKDLSVLPRAQLIRGGLDALGQKMPTEAMYYFGAAIRKARKVQLFDIEAEFYKFVTLYLEGDYREAVNRCLECLDGVKAVSDAAQVLGTKLPRDGIADKLADCLAQAMVMRRDPLFTLIGHFWQPQMGEYFLLKRPLPLFAAIAKAWMILHENSKITYDCLGTEMKAFSNFLQEQLDTAKDMLNEENDDTGEKSERRHREADDPADEPEEAKQADLAKQREIKITDFLKEVMEITIMGLSNTQIEELHDACRESMNVTNLGTVARIIDQLGPNSKKSYFSALAKNDLMSSKEAKLADKDAERLHDEVQEFMARLEAS